jgi:hypothetical protein
LKVSTIKWERAMEEKMESRKRDMGSKQIVASGKFQQ